MLCRIADLIVEVPEEGNMAPRCRDYLTEGAQADIVIHTKDYVPELWPGLRHDQMCYMESGILFYVALLLFDGLMLHASAVEYEGRAYLFSGDCGAGKSTHTRLWQQVFGEKAQVFNDDKPALRRVEDMWYAYGTPWSGKHGINQNKRVPLAGICFLKHGQENRIRRLTNKEAIIAILAQTNFLFKYPDKMNRLLKLVDDLLSRFPIWEMENVADADSVRLSYETMSGCNSKQKLL